MTNQNQIFFIEQFIICIFIYPYISSKSVIATIFRLVTQHIHIIQGGVPSQILYLYSGYKGCELPVNKAFVAYGMVF